MISDDILTRDCMMRAAAALERIAESLEKIAADSHTQAATETSLTREEIEDLVESYSPQMTEAEEELIDRLKPFFDPIRDNLDDDEPSYLIDRGTAPASLVIRKPAFDLLDGRAWNSIRTVYAEFIVGNPVGIVDDDGNRTLAPRPPRGHG
jgi:hypothetical protein